MKLLEQIIFLILATDCFLISYLFYKSENGFLRKLLILMFLCLGCVDITNLILATVSDDYNKISIWLMIPFAPKVVVMTSLTVFLYKKYKIK